MGWRALKLWGPPLVYMAAIFAVSHVPGEDLGSVRYDKLVHALEYAVLAALLARALAGGLWRVSRPRATFATQ